MSTQAAAEKPKTKSGRKVIITCAVTGSVHTPTMSPYLPITPDQIAADSIAAAEAGAAVIHLHARNPEDGSPTPDPKVFMQFLPRIKQNCDAVINITTGGSLGMSMEDRAGGAAACPAGALLAQHGLDEFRHLPRDRQDHRMESIPGKRPMWSGPRRT